ncbi:MAG TPA: 50S ribosomal protein L13 [candidate division WOR-3 bacterium]|uniref:Large ribosomal subunit protein uL13 n=1 Tax=candidate division WOR-3 bacterium TaxID=2052148 RepID=A0A7V0LUJ1_UNCW3|nr:MAG: 50S ribosomal protein L13 [Candidatus Hydrothermae bacterium]HDL60259.1 50S ribosomal protein L13 [candidate division WOR-3 bacterium]
MKTFLPSEKDIKRNWWLVDAEGLELGRLASRIALLLQGKRKRIYTPHIDTGDFVVVVNAEKVKLTGRKLDTKIYYHHSGYPGGLKARTARQILESHPERLIQLAVKRMLPKNKLGRKMFKRLKVYRGPEHPHEAQKPQELDIMKIN